MGEDGGAEGALSKALNLEPQSVDYLFALIDFHYKRGHLNEALEFAEQMIITHPENRLGHDIKAAIQAQQE